MQYVHSGYLAPEEGISDLKTVRKTLVVKWLLAPCLKSMIPRAHLIIISYHLEHRAM